MSGTDAAHSSVLLGGELRHARLRAHSGLRVAPYPTRHNQIQRTALLVQSVLKSWLLVIDFAVKCCQDTPRDGTRHFVFCAALVAAWHHRARDACESAASSGTSQLQSARQAQAQRQPPPSPRTPRTRSTALACAPALEVACAAEHARQSDLTR
eukprot:1966571-Rhodomonas_salina.2